MTYLVLRSFRCYGKRLVRGSLHDESEIRSPRLRVSEGKIIPAVSSSDIPVESADVEEASADSQDSSENTVDDSKPEEQKIPNKPAIHLSIKK